MVSKYISYVKNPFFRIYIVSFFVIWTLWDFIIIPSGSKSGVSSQLLTENYSPVSNLLRFGLAIIFPTLACGLFAYLHNKRFSKKLAHYLSALLTVLCLLLATAAAIVQSSTNPANNVQGEYGGPYKHAMLDTFHEGETLGSAVSYQRKDLKPYRDFVIVHGVFQDPLRSVIAFKIFGRSIGAARAFAVILTIISLCMLVGLFLLLFERNVAKTIIGLLAITTLMLPANIFPFLHTFLIGIQFPFRDIATIIFLALAIWSLRDVIRYPKISSKLPIATIGIGFIATAGFANSIDRAMYIAVLSLVWLTLILAIAGWRLTLRHIIPYGAAGAIIGIVILGAALKWEYASFLDYLATMAANKEYLDGIIFTRPDLRTALLLLCLGGILFWGSMRYKESVGTIKKSKLAVVIRSLRDFAARYPIEIILFATALFFLRSAIGRADFAHFAYSIQWLYVFLLYVSLSRSRLNLRTITATTYCLLLLFAGAALLHASLVKNIDIRRDTFPIRMPDTAFLRPDYIEAAAFLKEKTKGAPTFMTLTSEGSWYYLTNEASPSRYFVIWYAFLPEQKEEVTDTLAYNRQIRYVVTNNNWTSKVDYIPNSQRFPETYRVLEKQFTPIRGFGQQTIWQRNM